VALLGTACGETPPSLPGEEDPPCDLVEDTYRITSAGLGETSTEATLLARDVDGDGDPDDVLVGPYLNLRTAGAPLDVAIDAALVSSVRWSLVIGRCVPSAMEDGYRRVSMIADSALEVAPVPVVGTLVDGEFESEQGIADVPLSTFLDSLGTESPTGWASGYGFRLELRFLENESVTGVAAFGFEFEEALARVAPAIANTLNELIDGAPGCPASCEDSLLRSYVNAVDADRDGVFSAEEVTEVRSLFIAKDANLFADWKGSPVYWPLHDAELDASGLSVSFVATRE